MKQLSLLLVLTAVAGCRSTGPEVEQYGVMREVLRDGRTGPRIALEDAVARPHAYAVGAMEGLRGEVTILDGVIWITRVDDAGVPVTDATGSEADHATLLTLAHVAAWQTHEITVSAEGAALESLIESTARAAGVDTSTPFPFILEGDAAGLAVHVVNETCPLAADPDDTSHAPWRWSSETRTAVTIVGFHAPNAAGVMTHHGSSIHAHALFTVDGQGLTGHVEHLRTSPGMVLRIPADRSPGRSEEAAAMSSDSVSVVANELHLRLATRSEEPASG